MFPLNLPPIIGLSTNGGFEYQLENLEGRPPEETGSVMQGLVAAANQDPRLARVFSTFTAANPAIWLDIDREKAQALGLSIADVFTRCRPRWVALHKRFQYVRPYLAGEHPGRCVRPQRHPVDQ